MKGILLDNMDIDLFLTENEFWDLNAPAKPLEIKNKKLIVLYEPLECRLQKMDGSYRDRNVNLQFEDFKESGDGIKVDYKKEIYFIKINKHAFDRVDEKGHFGTRYGGGEKITIYISERTSYHL